MEHDVRRAIIEKIRSCPGISDEEIARRVAFDRDICILTVHEILAVMRFEKRQEGQHLEHSPE